MSAALLTSDTPRWLFLALVALVAVAYLAWAVPALTRWARPCVRRRGWTRPSARALTSRPKEITS